MTFGLTRSRASVLIALLLAGLGCGASGADQSAGTDGELVSGRSDVEPAATIDVPLAGRGQERFVSPVVDGYRFVARPLAVIVRAGEGSGGPAAGYEVYFRLNRALPRRGTTRGSLDGDSGYPAAMGIGRRSKHCFWQPIDGGPPTDAAKAGDPATFSLRLGGIRRALTVRVELIDELPRIVNDDGLGVGNAPYEIRLGCASDRVRRWAREQR